MIRMSTRILRMPRTTGYGLRTILLLSLLLAGCQLFKQQHQPVDKTAKGDEQLPALPSRHSLRVSQYVFYSDREMKSDQPLFQELSDLRDQVCKELQLPTANTVIQVYLFEDEKRYERYMKARYPELPRRRAFFVAQPRSVGGTEDLFVYTYWGDNIRKDLRHELTHALLNSVLEKVPLWLDEGLAEYYEAPPERWGVNPSHLEQLRTEKFQPDLSRLERLDQLHQMTPAEYRESWAWVHLMLRDKVESRAVLLKYLQHLRHNRTPALLQPRLAEIYPAPEEALQKHLVQLAATQRAAR